MPRPTRWGLLITRIISFGVNRLVRNTCETVAWVIGIWKKEVCCLRSSTRESVLEPLRVTMTC